jgi:hypothetical protein
MQLDKNDSSDDELKKVERLLDHESAKGAYPVAYYRQELES